MDHSYALRTHNAAQAQSSALRDLRAHPLALTPRERERLEDCGAIRRLAPVLLFTPAPRRGDLIEIARDYLSRPRPHGYAKELARKLELNYSSLLSTIGKLQRGEHT